MTIESILVSAWKCGMCDRVHAEQSGADDCCKCSGCGNKFDHNDNMYRSRCDACEYGSNVREARKALERAEYDVKRSRDRLENLINNPPPGKKRPKKGVS
jgi:hypothetical protein